MITATEAASLRVRKVFTLQEIEEGIKMMAIVGSAWAQEGTISPEDKQELERLGYIVTPDCGSQKVLLHISWESAQGNVAERSVANQA